MQIHLGFRGVATAALVPLFIGITASAQERRLLSGHIPAVAANTAAVGRLPAASSLNLAIGLPLRNQAALSALLQQIYDPASPNYRHYLTPDQFTEQFGPTEADYQAVIAFALAHGLAVTGMHSHRMLLDVAGSVANVEGAFQTTLRTYKHPTEARTFYAPDVEPSVEAGVPVADISGLSNLRVPRAKNRKPIPLSRTAKAKPKVGSSSGGLYIGNDFRAAYAPGVALTGTGQMVGMLEFDGYYATDITQYEGLAGLPNVPLQNVLLDGFNGTPTTGANSGNSEVALDIEMVIAVAPSLSKVVVYEAGPNGLANDVLSAMSTNTAIKQFGCSWDFGTTPRATMDGLFQKMAAQGQSFFNASGDGGAFTGSWPEPDDDPYITLVGGTTLATCGPGGAWLSETAWNAGDGFNISSGGFSSNYSLSTTATWQQGISMAANAGSTTLRNIPDVAMAADGIFIVADNGMQEISGGTSASAQLWAGFAALANQQATASGQGAIGFINPAIYALGKSARYSSVFNDTTAGNITNGVPTQFFAVPGYDLCTGWGSPAGGSLILALATPDRLVITPGASAAANGPVGGPFSITTESLSLSNAGSTSLNWSLSNTSAWLNVSPASGTLAGGGAATPVNVNLNPAANSLPAGVYTANLVVSNSSSGLVQIRQFTLLVGQEMVQDGGFEVGDFAYWNLFGPFATDNNYADDGTYTGLTAFDGTWFAVLGATNALDYLTQTLPTRAGQPYLLSFWLQSADLGGGTTPNQFLVKWNNTTLVNQVNLGVFDWTSMQYVVTGAGPSTVLEFGFRDDPGYLALDDVSVMPIAVPMFQSAAKSGNTVTLTWTAQTGATYQLQYKTNVTATNWVNLGSPTNATSGKVSFPDTIGPDSLRFYRVALMP
jgi:subtilase family serine protease